MTIENRTFLYIKTAVKSLRRRRAKGAWQITFRLRRINSSKIDLCSDLTILHLTSKPTMTYQNGFQISFTPVRTYQNIPKRHISSAQIDEWGTYISTANWKLSPVVYSQKYMRRVFKLGNFSKINTLVFRFIWTKNTLTTQCAHTCMYIRLFDDVCNFLPSRQPSQLNNNFLEKVSFDEVSCIGTGKQCWVK